MSTSFSKNTVVTGNVKEVLGALPSEPLFDCTITSPPYYDLREYGEDPAEIGHEESPTQYVENLIEVFKHVLIRTKDSGSLWVNIADTFRGGPLGVPRLFLDAMKIETSWNLMNEIIWYKIDAMAESSKGRFSRKYEMFYWFVKNKSKYYFDNLATKIPVKISSVQRLEYKFNKGKTSLSRMRGMIGEKQEKIDQYLDQGVNCGDVWATVTNKERVEHSAPYPRELIARPIVATCPKRGIILDPFTGSGTTGMAALELGRDFFGVELYETRAAEARQRIAPFIGLQDFGFEEEQADVTTGVQEEAAEELDLFQGGGT